MFIATLSSIGSVQMANCVMCGSPIPDDQGSKTCSMCYGDIDHGKDGYYRDYMEQQPEPEPEPVQPGQKK